jgi:hypothetical protein
MNFSKLLQCKFRDFGIAAVVTLSLFSCQSSEKLRREASQAYRVGEVAHAANLLDEAIRIEDPSIPAGEGPPPPKQWKLDNGDAPLIALERAMVYLRQGDTTDAAELLRACRNELRARRLDTFLKYVGLDGISAASSLLVGDWVLPYSAPSYEELTAHALLMLVARLDFQANTDGAAPFANGFHSVQDELLKSSYGVQYEDLIKRPEQTLAFGHYIEGAIREEGNVDAAIPAYSVAAKALSGQSIVDAALIRARSLQREPTGSPVHVFYLLGNGPQLESSRWQPKESDPYIEAAVRIVTTAIDIIKRTLVDGEDYHLADGLIKNLTEAPIPVPFLVTGDPHIRPTSSARISFDTAGTVQAVESPIEPIADFHSIAKTNLESLRIMRMSRALLRRALKEASLQTIGNSVLRDATRLLATVAEDADTRLWSTLPAEICTARLVAPPGQHELVLGLEGAGTVPIQVAEGRGTWVVVIDSGEAVPRPTILVDALSRVEPTPSANTDSVPHETPPPEPLQ